MSLTLAGATAIAGGMGLLGNLIGTGSQAKATKEQFAHEKELMALQAQYNKDAAAQSQQYAKDLWSFTNFENQVKHAKAAGLNPALLYGQGGGGGTSAAGATQQGVGNPGTSAVAMGLQAKAMMSQIAMNTAQAMKTTAEAKKIEGVDTAKAKTEIDLMKTRMSLNESLESLNYANESVAKEKAQEVRKNVEKLTAETEGIIINNEINESTKDAQIGKVLSDSKNAIIKGWLMESQIDANKSQKRLLDEKANNFFYQIYTDRMKANAAIKSADASERSAAAAESRASNYEKWVQEFAKDVKSNSELREIMGDKFNNEIFQEWIRTGVASISQIADIIFTRGMAGKVTETVKRTFDQEGNQTGESHEWSRKRNPIK